MNEQIGNELRFLQWVLSNRAVAVLRLSQPLAKGLSTSTISINSAANATKVVDSATGLLQRNTKLTCA